MDHHKPSRKFRDILIVTIVVSLVLLILATSILLVLVLPDPAWLKYAIMFLTLFVVRIIWTCWELECAHRRYEDDRLDLEIGSPQEYRDEEVCKNETV